MIKIIGSDDKEYDEILNIRNNVLRIPLGLDIKNDDLSKEGRHQHVAYFSGSGQIIGCLQIKKLTPDTFQIRQMAVLPEYQRHGIGVALLSEAESVIKRRLGKEIIIESRDYAIKFYEKNGYRATGQFFIKINIPHKLMRKEI